MLLMSFNFDMINKIRFCFLKERNLVFEKLLYASILLDLQTHCFVSPMYLLIVNYFVNCQFQMHMAKLRCSIVHFYLLDFVCWGLQDVFMLFLVSNYFLIQYLEPNFLNLFCNSFEYYFPMKSKNYYSIFFFLPILELMADLPETNRFYNQMQWLL